MPTIIAIDPGLTTGLAVAVDGKIVETADLDAHDVPRLLAQVHDRYFRQAPVVYVEEGPAVESNARAVIEAIEREIASTFAYMRIEKVLPATWKPHPRSKDVTTQTFSAHQKDAVGIASYAVWAEARR